MLRRTSKIALATAAVVGTLGAGVAVAADPPACPYGNTPQAGQSQQGTTTQPRLRKRDGTGPRHAQRSARREQRQGGRQGRGRGCGGDCPNAAK